MQCELFSGLDSTAASDGSSSKTSPDSSQATREQTLLQWLERSLGPSLAFREMGGKTPELHLDRKGSASGAYWMRSGSEFRNGASACSLSEILETGQVEARYFLSARACQGILRRAEKRGKTLPTALEAALRSSDVIQYGDRTGPLDTNGSSIAVAFHENQRAEITMNDTTGALGAGGGKPGQGYPAAMQGMSVRRLTPRECERLQGFPDDYTLIPVRGKPAADGPRYKALGNSMAVPVMAWIGRRIQMVEDMQ
jgi:hypothetical protein